MKLKTGLLLTVLIVAQAPLQAGVFQATSPEAAAQKKALLEGVSAYYPKPSTPSTSTATTYKDIPVGITPEQQAIYDKLNKQIKIIAESVDKDIIPVVERAVVAGSFGFFEGASLGSTLLFTLALAIYSAIDSIIELHKANPNARAIIKHNLEGTFKAAKFDALVARLTSLVNKLPAGIVKDQLLEYVPKLNEIPALVASQL